MGGCVVVGWGGMGWGRVVLGFSGFGLIGLGWCGRVCARVVWGVCIGYSVLGEGGGSVTS